MKSLSPSQKTMVINHLYPASKCEDVRDALVMVINEGSSLYAAEAEYNINKNTLNPKVKRVKELIKFIETLNDSE